MEECDDNNILNDDGCSENCTVEDHYHCTQTNSSLPSDCVQVLLDLSSGDHTTLDRSLEFSSLITPISLVDPSTLDFLVLVVSVCFTVYVEKRDTIVESSLSILYICTNTI